MSAKGKLRFTMLQITLNTNKAPYSEGQELYYMNEMRTFLRSLADERKWRTLINITPDFSVIEKIDVQNIGIERGKHKRRIHAHFIVTIQHRGKVNYKNTQAKWQDLLKTVPAFSKGGYANVRLMNSRIQNYVVKSDSEVDVIRTRGIRPPVVF